MKIRMLRNVLVAGAHCEAGQVVDVDERLAIQLIQWQRAEPAEIVKVDQVTAPETATAEPNSETAVKPAAKKRAKGDK